MENSLQLYVGTVLVGDAINPPILKAASDFPNDHIVYAKDPNFGGTINFYVGIKNLVIDSTAVNANNSLTLLDWTVSQATQLANVVFNMPDYSTGHTGISSQYDYNSNVILNDLTFNGGAYGVNMSGQQWIFKNIKTNGTTTGMKASGNSVVCLACSFANTGTGIDASVVGGVLSVIDTTGTNVGTLISGSSSSGAGHSIVLDNISNSGTTVSIDGKAVVNDDVADTWVYGSLVRIYWSLSAKPNL